MDKQADKYDENQLLNVPVFCLAAKKRFFGYLLKSQLDESKNGTFSAQLTNSCDIYVIRDLFKSIL